MRPTLLLAALMAGAVSGTAAVHAADSDMSPDFRPSSFEVYVGAFGASHSLRTSFALSDGTLRGDLDGTSYGFGLRAGADREVNGWVLGAAGDWSFGGDIGRDTGTGSESSMLNLATMRARAGRSFGGALVYLTGGAALAELEYAVDNEGEVLKDSAVDWTWGWTLGGGLRFAISDSLALGLEYLYLDFGEADYTIEDGTLGVKQDIGGMHAVRLGVDYRFPVTLD